MPKVLIQLKANPEQTREVSERDGRVLVKLGRWEYVTTALEGGPPKRKRRLRTPADTPAQPEPEPPPAPTETVPEQPPEPTEPPPPAKPAA